MAVEHKLMELIAKRVVIADGAMGTTLYQRGIFLNRCFDELNLTNPDIVKKVHSDYIDAGVDFIETNTFGANEFKLAKAGLADEVEKINTVAVEIAKSAAADQVLVAGAIGPVGCEITDHSNLTLAHAFDIFKRQAKALITAGVDFLLLETFSNTDELLAAINAAAEVTSLPIIAQITVNKQNETIYGQRIESAISQIASHPAVSIVGLNCSVGPVGMLSSLEKIRTITEKPISVMPNAGMPRQIENRMLYMCTPEYMAEYAKRFFEKGAKVIGGCCGTSPEHIAEMAKAINSLNKTTTKKIQTPTIDILSPQQPKPYSGLPLAEKSNLGAKLAAGQKVTMIEITPPRGIDLTGIIEKAKLCAQFGVDCINIPDGPRASSRVSPLVTAVKIQQQTDIETILHFCARDRNLIGMQSDLLGAAAIGLKNILIITGDPPKTGEYPDATGVFDLDSIALTSVLKNLNQGIDIGSTTFSPPTSLTIGVGANPVATDMEKELERFRQKVLAGAEYAITQPVFDVNMLFDFLDSIESFKIPIIAGIWPFTSFKNAEFMANEVPGVKVPHELLERMSHAKTKQQGREIGIQIAKEMIEKISDRVQGLAVSAPFGNIKMALAVLGKIDVDQL